ncbi:hypothetical protein [Synechococcus sp. CS-205]|uniref:hypothetical protein n=1 Tax=Synechococcus sp. CS-205 TaxID=2847984 RepID=UPI00223AA4F3|nr:hypothetical protein [Synechococcus sp. CS-205]MCT0248100.1 hypothetical protein [Synechococcus sp. CS-205]
MQLHVPSPGPFVPLALAAATLLSWAAIPAPARSELLYKLETECSLKRGPAQPCSVEATNEEGATLYRHTIGEKEELIKITSTPTRMSLWDPASKAWTYLSSAGALFSTNTICFNGRDLCVVNANYLNSVVEERPEATEGRDLIRVKFGADGRVDLSCYDEACEEVN